MYEYEYTIFFNILYYTIVTNNDYVYIHQSYPYYKRRLYVLCVLEYILLDGNWGTSSAGPMVFSISSPHRLGIISSKKRLIKTFLFLKFFGYLF